MYHVYRWSTIILKPASEYSAQVCSHCVLRPFTSIHIYVYVYFYRSSQIRAFEALSNTALDDVQFSPIRWGSDAAVPERQGQRLANDLDLDAIATPKKKGSLLLSAIRAEFLYRNLLMYIYCIQSVMFWMRLNQRALGCLWRAPIWNSLLASEDQTDLMYSCF